MPDGSTPVNPCIFLFPLIALLTGPTYAEDRYLTHQDIEKLTAEYRLVPLKPLIDATARRLHGRYIGVELARHDDAYQYELKWLDPEGRLREVVYDARTGALIAIERGEDD